MPRLRQLCLLASLTACLHPGQRDRKEMVEPSASATNTDQPLVGTVPGKGTVSATGASQYEMPLPIPPGIGKHQPALAVMLSSQANEGTVGYGGLLSGFSAVTRCSTQRGGVTYPVRYDADDRFCLDGELLILASGTYGADGAVYRTERDAFSEITSQGDTCGTGPCSFTVRTPLGETRVYGDDARVEAVPDSSVTTIPDGSVRIWPVQTRADRNHNTITFQYTVNEDTGEYRPDTVLWTSNPSAQPAQGAQRAASFHYTDMDASDTDAPLWFFQGGARVVQSQLLDHIDTCVSKTPITGCDDDGAEPVLTRSLEYEYAAYTGHHRLTTVTDTGSDGAALPATTFTWQDPTSTTFADPIPWSTEFSQESGWDPSTQPRLVGDLNGDGRSDIVGFGSKLHYALSDGQAFTPFETADDTVAECSEGHDCLFDNPRALGDVDGDGRADVVAFEGGGVYVQRFGDSGFGDVESWGDLLAEGWSGDDLRQVADLNADGLADIIGFGASHTECYLSDGASGFDTTNVCKDAAFSQNDGFSLSGGNPPVITDVNGDGAADIVGFYSKKVYVSLWSGSSFGPTTVWMSDLTVDDNGGTHWSATETPRRVADVNGDGLSDIVGFREKDVVVALSTGRSFTAPMKWENSTFSGWDDANGSQRILGDVNADGRADIIGFTETDVLFAVARQGAGGTITFDTTAVSGPDSGFGFGSIEDRPRFPQIVTGDVSPSLVVFGDSAVYVSAPPSGAVDRLTSAVNGLGAETEWSYGLLSEPDADDWYTSQPPDTDLPIYREYRAAMQVVTQMVFNDGDDASYTYDHRWSGAVERIDQTGFLGFRSHTIIDRAINPDAGAGAGQSHTTRFQLSFFDGSGQPLIDRAMPIGDVISRTADDFILHRSTTELTAMATESESDAFTAYFLHPTSEEVTSYSDSSDESVTTRQGFSFDTWGNPRLVFDEGDVADTADDLYTCMTWQVDEGAWMLAFPDTIHQTHGACTVTGDACDCPDDEAGSTRTDIRYSDDGRSNTTQLRSYDDVNGSWLGTEMHHDAFGNVTRLEKKSWASTDDTDGTTFTWDERTYDDTYQTFVATASNAFYQTTATHDAGTGQVLTATDPAGVTRTSVYDGFGRLTDTYGPGPDGTGSEHLSHIAWGQDSIGWFAETTRLQRWDGTESVSRQYMDRLGRSIRSTKTTSDSKTIIQERAYSGLRQLKSHSLPYFSGDTPDQVVQNYDSLGRLERLDLPSGDAITSSFDIATVDGLARQAISSTVLDSAGDAVRQVTVFSDPDGRTVRRDFPSINDGATPSARTDRDAHGRITAIKAPDGTKTTISYDSLGRRKQAAGAVRGTTTWAWDSSGSAVTVTTATGDTITRTYDDLMREATRVLASAGGDTRTMTFTYDDATAGDFGMGRLTQVDDTAQGGMQTRYTYDAYGNTASSTRQLDSHTFTQRSSYSPLRQLTGTTFPDGSAAQWTWDATGPLLSLGYCEGATGCTDSDPAPIGAWSALTAQGYPQTATLGDSVVTEARTYDVLGRPKATTITAGSQTLLDELTTWASLYDVQTVDDRTDDRFDRAYTYLLTGYVDTATIGGRDLSFTYDNEGGSLESWTQTDGGQVTATIDAQQISSLSTPEGEQSTGYTADGALSWLGSSETADDTMHFEYDPQGTLISAHGPGIEEQWLVDHTGRTVRTQRSDGAVVYDLSQSLQVTVLADGTELVTRSLYSTDDLVATITTGGGPQWQSDDLSDTLAPGPNGSGLPVAGQTLLFSTDMTHGTSLVVDADSAAVVSRVTYDPFGVLSAESAGTDAFMQKFQGFKPSPDSALIPMGSRTLSPHLGRFTRPDRNLIGAMQVSPAAYNAYAFGGNNWVSFVDPSGRGAAYIAATVGVAVSLTVASVVAPEAEPLIIALSVTAGGYMGAASVNQGALNPKRWDYKTWRTYTGMTAGAIISGVGAGGGSFAVGKAETTGAKMLTGIVVGATTGALNNATTEAITKRDGDAKWGRTIGFGAALGGLSGGVSGANAKTTGAGVAGDGPVVDGGGEGGNGGDGGDGGNGGDNGDQPPAQPHEVEGPQPEQQAPQEAPEAHGVPGGVGGGAPDDPIGLDQVGDLSDNPDVQALQIDPAPQVDDHSWAPPDDLFQLLQEPASNAPVVEQQLSGLQSGSSGVMSVSDVLEDQPASTK